MTFERLTDKELAQMRRYLADHPVGKRLIAGYIAERAESERLRSALSAARGCGR